LDLMDDFDAMSDEVTKDDTISVVVLASKLPRFFMAGADIQMIKDNWERINLVVSRFQECGNRIEQIPKPTIAAIRGVAAGGGCEIALACDFRLASQPDTLIGVPEVHRGLIPAGGGTQRLLRLVGKRQALKLTMFGDLISADQAYSIGLVDGVFEADDLMEKALAHAKRLASISTEPFLRVDRSVAVDLGPKSAAFLSGSR
jgi:enoyl-CoA hydratase